MLVLYLGAFVRIFLDILSFLIIVRVLLSWFPNRPHHAAFDFIIETTQPVMRVARKITPRIGMLDLSPVIALLALDLLKTLFLALLSNL